MLSVKLPFLPFSIFTIVHNAGRMSFLLMDHSGIYEQTNPGEPAKTITNSAEEVVQIVLDLARTQKIDPKNKVIQSCRSSNWLFGQHENRTLVFQ